MASVGEGLGVAGGVNGDHEASAPHPSGYRLLRDADPALNDGRLEVAFVDNSLPDYQALVAGVKPGMAVVLIDATQDGLSQMAAWGGAHAGYDAVHVLGHGAEGRLQLGSLMLDTAVAEARAEDLAKLGAALSDEGDLLLYGCDVASGEGEALVSQLAAATGADVAASDDETGAWAAGADWDLEVTSGDVTAQSVSAFGYEYTLNIVGSTVTDNYDSSGTVGDGVELDYGSFKVDVSASGIIIEGIGNSFSAYSLTFSGGSLASIDSIIYDSANSTIEPSDYSGFTPTISQAGLTISWTALAGNDSGNNKIAYTIGTTATGPADTTPPTATVATVSVNNATDVTTIQSTETGTAYLVKEGSSVTDKASLDTLAAGNDANSVTVTSADTNTTISTTGLVDGKYYLYAVDSAGNVSAQSTNFVTLDSTAPTVTSIARLTPSAETTNADSLVYRVTLSESVSNLDSAEFAVTGTTGTVTGVSGSGTTYDVTVSGGDVASANGTVTLGFAGGQDIADGAGNALANTTPSGTNESYTLDNSGPTVTSIARLTPVTETTDADSLVYRVTFSESVSNLDAADFAVTGTTGTVTDVSGSGTTYDLTVSGGDLASLNGAVTLGFAGGQNITDSIGNALADTTPTGTNQSYTLDNSGPTVTSIARLTPSAETTSADTLVYRVTFSESVINIGAADFSVTGTTGTVTGVSGSGTTYDVTVSGGDVASANGTVTLGFGGGQDIADGAGNALANTTPSGTNESYTLDNSGPTVTSIARLTPGTETTDADSLVYRVTFNESVAGLDAADFAVTGTTGTVTGVSGSGTTYDLTVSGGDLASLNGAVTLGFAGGQDITDSVGNALADTTPTGTHESYTLDNPPPTVSLTASGSPFAEDAGVATLTATLSAAASTDTTVNLAFSGTATANSDYSVSAAAITITAGQTSATATLTGMNDALNEGDETVIVDIASVTGGGGAAENGTQQTTLTITDDEVPPTVTLSASGSPLAENGGVATVTATLSAAADSDTTVTLTPSGTATGTADYTLSTTTLTIVAGQTTATATVTGVDDSFNDEDETVILDISAVSGGGGATENGTQSTTLTITDDDPAPTVSLSSSGSPLAENAGVATVTATLSAAASTATTITLTASGTATGNGTDYTLSASTLTIDAGQTTATATVTSVNDATHEGNETVILDITGVSGGDGATESGTQTSTLTITDDDPADSGDSGGGSTPAIVVTPTAPTAPATGGSGTTSAQTITNNGSSSGSAAIVENTNNNGNLVTATLPPSTTITSEGPTTAQSPTDALTTLITSIQARGSSAETPLVSGARTFLNKLATTTTLDVRTIIPTTTSSSLASPIVITGTNGGSQSEAFVIDMRSLPSGSNLQLDNIEFASVMGSATVIGGSGDNYVTGDDNSQFISLGVGDDTLFGGAGADTIGSGSGRDFLYGNEDNDVVFGGTEDDSVYGGQNDDVVYGNQANDLVYGNRGADTLYGGQDDDTLYGGQQEDLVHGNRGEDVLYGNTGADTLTGGEGNDILYGDEGADRLSGGAGNDTLYGGLSSDTGADGESYDIMYGGAGDDVFYGGEGVDWIYTGDGADQIVIESLNGFDVVADFDVAAGDRLLIAANVNGLNLTSAADVIALASDNPDGDVEFDLGGQNVRLIGIRTADLTTDFFEFY